MKRKKDGDGSLGIRPEHLPDHLFGQHVAPHHVAAEHWPLPNNTEIPLVPRLPIARSGLPSPLKPATTTDWGSRPTARREA